jgi:hypothetical protein
MKPLPGQLVSPPEGGIDDVGGKGVCWITWAQRKSGTVELRAISLYKKHSEFARQAVEYEIANKRAWADYVERTWSEEVEFNHIWGEGMSREWMVLASKTRPREGD